VEARRVESLSKYIVTGIHLDGRNHGFDILALQPPFRLSNPNLKFHPEKLRDSKDEPNNIPYDKKPFFSSSAGGL